MKLLKEAETANHSLASGITNHSLLRCSSLPAEESQKAALEQGTERRCWTGLVRSVSKNLPYLLERGNIKPLLPGRGGVPSQPWGSRVSSALGSSRGGSPAAPRTFLPTPLPALGTAEPSGASAEPPALTVLPCSQQGRL